MRTAALQLIGAARHRPLVLGRAHIRRLTSDCGAAAPPPAPAASSSPAAPASAGAAGLPVPGDPAWDDGEVFRCAGIEGNAVGMRRRVQCGIGLEVVGTQLINVLFHNSWEAFVIDSSTSYFENSAALLGVHVLVVWRYHAFLRDALLARHVTRIAVLERPGEAAADQGGQESWAVLVETGPWARRMELERHLPSETKPGGPDRAVDSLGEKVPFGQLVQLGVLHVDRHRGEVLDPKTFELLLTEDLVVKSEEVTTDMGLLQYSFVSPDKLVPFLAEVGVPDSSGSSFWQQLLKNEWVHRTFQVNGGRAMDFFGKLALAMGVGSVFVAPMLMSKRS